MIIDYETFRLRVDALLARMSEACLAAGREPREVALLPVTKTHPAAAVEFVARYGLPAVGENRVQDALDKQAQVPGVPVRWPLIGHLQTNKAGKAIEIFSAVDSVDSLRLAEKLNAAASASKRIPVLIELNLGGEESKSGLNPVSLDFGALLEAAARLDHLEFRGLMTVPPFTEEPEGSRLFFRRLREIRDRIAARNLPAIRLDTLSMGMSHDFEVAIEEGSTCVRLGTAIFGERTAKA